MQSLIFYFNWKLKLSVCVFVFWFLTSDNIILSLHISHYFNVCQPTSAKSVWRAAQQFVQYPSQQTKTISDHSGVWCAMCFILLCFLFGRRQQKIVWFVIFISSYPFWDLSIITVWLEKYMYTNWNSHMHTVNIELLCLHFAHNIERRERALFDELNWYSIVDKRTLK